MADAIGNLFVSLGINTAQFEAGLNKARGSLDKFGKVSDAAMAAVTAAAAGAAVALGVAVKGAIDHADELSKAAQKAGVTTEALSRLEYAAKLSDVSLESLSGGLGKLGRAMVDVASGGATGAKTAFEALGVSVTTATGALRDPNAVFAEVADRFARMENGATKTALAVEIFGKSGADLIPLLNSGADGLKAMADEADRLGLTIDTQSGQEAEEFNDTLTRLQLTLDGIVNQIAMDSLPALQSLADALADEDFRTALNTLVGWFSQAFTDSIIPFIESTANEIRIVQALAQGDFGAMLTPQKRLSNLREQLATELADAKQAAELRNGPFANTNAMLGGINGPAMNSVGYGANAADLALFGFGTGAKSDAATGAGGAGQIGTPFQPVISGVGKVDEALKKSKDEMADWALKMDQSVEDAARAAEEAAQRFEQAWTGTTQLVTGALDALAGVIGSSTKESFEMSKKLSMASAIVAGIEASVQAFKKGNELGGLPLGLLWGGIAAATAAAKVAAIQSTSFNSTSMASGSAGGSASTSTAGGAAGASQGLSIVLNGSADSKVSLGQVGDLINQINDYLGTQGKQLVVNYKGA